VFRIAVALHRSSKTLRAKETVSCGKRDRADVRRRPADATRCAAFGRRIYERRSFYCAARRCVTCIQTCVRIESVWERAIEREKERERVEGTVEKFIEADNIICLIGNCDERMWRASGQSAPETVRVVTRACECTFKYYCIRRVRGWKEAGNAYTTRTASTRVTHHKIRISDLFQSPPPSENPLIRLIGPTYCRASTRPSFWDNGPHRCARSSPRSLAAPLI
jgi:hypothetical protein